jgi:hypothetical protein
VTISAPVAFRTQAQRARDDEEAYNRRVLRHMQRHEELFLRHIQRRLTFLKADTIVRRALEALLDTYPKGEKSGSIYDHDRANILDDADLGGLDDYYLKQYLSWNLDWTLMVGYNGEEFSVTVVAQRDCLEVFCWRAQDFPDAQVLARLLYISLDIPVVLKRYTKLPMIPGWWRSVSY